MTKITKRTVLESIRVAAENGADFGDVTADDVIAYVDTTIAQMDAKAAKAKERQAQTKAEGDELRKVIEGIVNDVPQVIDDITASVNAIEGYEDVTKSKVVARLSQLVKLGTVFKVATKVDGRRLMAYTTDNGAVEVTEAE